MNGKQLEAFLVVARTGTVTQAAKLLHSSQPAVSRLISRLESQVRLTLFRREHGRLHLTAEGSALLQEVQRHFTGLEAIKHAAQRIAEHGTDSLRIVAFPSLCSDILPRAIAEYLHKHPDTAITLDTETTDRIASTVETGAYDIGFTAGSGAKGEAVSTQIIDSRPWICAFHPQHPLSTRKAVTVEELSTVKLIGFFSGMSLRAQVDAVFAKHGVQANYVIAAQTIESICGLISVGCGSAILHPYAANTATLRQLSTVPLDDQARLDLIAVTPRLSLHTANEFTSIVETLCGQSCS